MIIVLLLISVMTIIMTLGFHIAELAVRMSTSDTQEFQEHFMTMAFEHVAQLLQHGQPLRCLFPLTLSAHDLRHRSVTWWHSVVNCHAQMRHRPFQYRVDSWGSDPCYLIKDSPAHFYRITLHYHVKQRQHIVQRTLAIPTVLSQSCQTRPLPLDEGWRSWCSVA